jgi:hypothetical protein
MPLHGKSIDLRAGIGFLLAKFVILTLFAIVDLGEHASDVRKPESAGIKQAHML